MIHVNGFIVRQGQRLLHNKRYAMLLAVLLATIPYTAWMSLAVISLVTLKKGWREGALLLMPALTAYLACMLASNATQVAIVDSLLTFIPCYLAACVLGMTVSWRAVASMFFLLAAFCAIILQIWVPEFITAQYQYIMVALREVHPDVLSKLVNDTSGQNQQMLANFLLGLQFVSLFFSAVSPLLLARSLQSQLFWPGEFQREMLMFRGNKIGVLMLVIMLIAVTQSKIIAMNLLPLLIAYFLLAGLSLSVHILARKKMGGALLLLLIPLFLVPFVMLPVYVILGSLDSLFNLRLYLPSRAGTTT